MSRYHSILNVLSQPLLLDQYGTNIGGAWSFRKLSSSYTGNCIRIRESGGNTETDIGFSGDYVDEDAITAFCGSNSGFIVKWYDQSGAFPTTNYGDIFSTSATNQPRIYNSGVLEKSNGFISTRTNRQRLQTANRTGSPPPAQDWLNAGWGFNNNEVAMFNVVFMPATGNVYDGWFGSIKYGSAFRTTIAKQDGTEKLELRSDYGSWTSLAVSTLDVARDSWNVGTTLLRHSPDTLEVNLNGNLAISHTYTPPSPFFREFGMIGGSASAADPFCGEWLLFQDIPSASDVSAIEDNIKTYYGI